MCCYCLLQLVETEAAFQDSTPSFQLSLTETIICPSEGKTQSVEEVTNYYTSKNYMQDLSHSKLCKLYRQECAYCVVRCQCYCELL